MWQPFFRAIGNTSAPSAKIGHETGANRVRKMQKYE